MVAKAEPTKQEQHRAEEIIRRLDKMKSDRGTLDSTLQEVSDRVLPRKSHITETYVPGKKRKITPELVNDTAQFANEDMAGGLFAHLCSGRWFGLKARNKALNESDGVKTWFMEVTRILLEELAVSNFNNEIYELLLDLGWCGTPCIGVLPGVETWLDFETYHFSEYYIAENNRKKVDTNYRRFKYTARQAVQEWGIENLGKDVQDAYNSPKKEDRDKKFEFIHAISPREEHSYNYPALSTRQPIASEWVDVKAKKMIRVSGYYEMPKFSPRWVKYSGDVWGRSPGMSALATIKLTNTMDADVVKAGQLQVAKPILAPDDGFIGTVRIAPRAIIYYRKSLQGKDKPETLDIGGRMDWAFTLIDKKENVIRRAFFNDLFVMLAEQTGTKTAYEIAERIEEKHSRIVAPIGRLQSGLFNGLIRCCIGILGRGGRLPPVPEELVGQEYEIEYISKLALALKVLEVRSLASGLEVMASLAEARPDMIDNWDTDEIARGVPERIGWPVDWIRDKEERDEIREARAAQEQALQALQAVTEAAKAAPGVSKTVEEGSVLAEIAGAA